MEQENGKRVWIFPDGDLPPAGDREPFGHEALMITNINGCPANITLDLVFEDEEPVLGLRPAPLGGMRVTCIRLDKPVGEQGYLIPHKQYSLILRSDVPVVACFGRLDVRQENMAYYSVQGYAF